MPMAARINGAAIYLRQASAGPVIKSPTFLMKHSPVWSGCAGFLPTLRPFFRQHTCRHAGFYFASAAAAAVAVAVAAMLGLNAALALAGTIATNQLAPLSLPPLAALLDGTTVQIGKVAMRGRILAVIGASAGVALVLRSYFSVYLACNPSVMTGMSVVGLLTIAIGVMHGMPQQVFGNGVQTL